MLALQLCRFNADMQRDGTPVTLQHELAPMRGVQYTLRAVVEHRGPDLTTGHYVAYTHPSTGGGWLLHDDALEASRPAGPVTVALQRAYLCFYVRAT